ncbi:MAG: site-specific DNA-methyltransferase, partial [Acidobacteria bacterium]|nr:site-specific DNA-methyltransferase [Acidobacteriota bacterium]
PPGQGPSRGGPSRFYYCSKASRADRNRTLGNATVDNRHPCVKPIDLMQWLVRLATPPGGTILDPFAGSGSTGVAALLESRSFLGIEQDQEHARTARLRLGADK